MAHCDMASIFVIFSKDCSFLVLLASLLFHRCVMPRAHDDCKFRDEWLVQDKYKEWVVKDGDPRLARCQFCMKSSKTKTKLKFGNLYFSWPKLFNTFSHILTSFFVHKCIHSIITHQYMSKLCILMQNLNF